MSGLARRDRAGSRWRRTLWMAALLLPAGALPTPATAQTDCATAPPPWVFCTDFEEGDFHLWDDWDGNPSPTNTLVADPGPFNLPGNHVARLFVPPGRGAADLTKVLSFSNDVLYARWYVKWEAGFDFTTPQHGSGQSGHRGRERQGRTIPHPGRVEIVQGFAVEKNRLNAFFQVGRRDADGLHQEVFDGFTIAALDPDPLTEKRKYSRYGISRHRQGQFQNVSRSLSGRFHNGFSGTCCTGLKHQGRRLASPDVLSVVKPAGYQLNT